MILPPTNRTTPAQADPSKVDPTRPPIGPNDNAEPNAASAGNGETDTNARASAAYNASVIAQNKQIAATAKAAASAKTTAFNDYINNVAAPYEAQQTERQNTLSEANAGGNGPAQFESDLVTDGGFTPSQAAQLESIYNADLTNPNISPAQIQIDLINSAPVKERYPAMAEMQAKGIAPISITQYQQIEQSLSAMGAAVGLPPTALSAQDVTNVIVNNIPITGGSDSIEGRLSQAAQWAENVTSASPDAWNQLQSMYGVTKGSLTAYALTGNEGVVGNQLTSAAIAGEAQQAGFGAAQNKNMLLQVAANGGTQASEASNIASASQALGLTGAGGARLSGTQLTSGELLQSAIGGNTPGETAGQAQINVTEAQKGAAAKFSGGGNYGSGGTSNAGGATE